jgi:hypothetical protein
MVRAQHPKFTRIRAPSAFSMPEPPDRGHPAAKRAWALAANLQAR